MQYMGGKTRQGKHIEEHLLRYGANCVQYIEPFMGGGAVFTRMAPHFPGAALGSDAHEDLMLMWAALKDGWQPPAELTREEWYRLKDETPSALRGFVGFGCSFGGRWFEGYASNSRGDNFCDVARRAVLKKISTMQEASFLHAHYTSLEPGPGTLVYCDPPYASTKPYSGMDRFDTEAFWATARRWADAGAVVLVSEYTAPTWAEEVWRRSATVSLNADTNEGSAVEKLFRVPPSMSAPAPTVGPMDDTSPDQCPEPCEDGCKTCQAAREAFDEVTDDPDHPRTSTAPQKGPWFGAIYDGRCSVSECRIYEGDRIRADGQGGYECEDCGDIGPDVPPASALAFGEDDYQAQASAAARRHLAAQEAAGARFEEPSLASEEYAAAVADDLFEDPTPREERPAKLNVSGQPEARRDYQKRYIVVDPDLGDFRRTVKEKKPKGITRATTFNKHAQNTIALNQWSKRNVVMGASLRPDILRRAHGLHHDNGKDQREALDRIVDELETAAGAKVASDEGTFLHEFCDQVDAGLKTWEDAPAAYQQDIKRYVQALAADGLEPVPGLIERTTFIREYGGVAGTFDRILYHRPSGRYIIGDLKTGKTMKYAMDETECQLWTYAHGVNQSGIYDWNTDTWGRAWPDMTDQDPDEYTPITVSETVGVIVHMPVQGKEAGEVYLRFANLERGRAYADLNWAVKSYEKSKVLPFSMPGAPESTSEGLENPTPPDVWTHLFAAVQSREEANELWSRAVEAGVGDAELDELVAVARKALDGKG